MADGSHLEPVTLSPWPSSNDSLTSSEDDLAVACGEVVHVLTPRGKASVRTPGPHPHWIINTIRVNRFSEQEWAFQSLAPTKDFSIGEEQSDSIAIGISWSYAGIGMHRRSVLAVLTSNLLLSLWESDGTLGKYKRTCIVNDYLSLSTDDQQDMGAARKFRRIRSFCWVPVIHAGSESHLHYLMVATDIHLIFVLRASKTSSISYGNWSIETVARFDLMSRVMPDTDMSRMSPLQLRLYNESPVSSICCHDWTDMISVEDVQGSFSRSAKVTLLRGQIEYHFSLNICFGAGPDRAEPAANRLVSIEFSTHASEAIRSPLIVRSQSLVVGDKETSPEAHFKNALKSMLRTFDQDYGLFGHHKVRFWGTCQVLKTTKHAACITLHPSDMIEHTLPSFQKCMLIFVDGGDSTTPTPRERLTAEDTYRKVLEFTASQVGDSSFMATRLDIRILRNLKMLSNNLVKSPELSKILADAIRNGMLRHRQADLNVASGSAKVANNLGLDLGANGVNDVQFPDADEQCEICSSTIAFSADVGSATCSSGHQFTRCNLSFVAVQEPGISKYCSGCGRQFLDLAKSGMQIGPSLISSLFEKFDVCPYCGAKFRG